MHGHLKVKYISITYTTLYLSSKKIVKKLAKFYIQYETKHGFQRTGFHENCACSIASSGYFSVPDFTEIIKYGQQGKNELTPLRNI